jgi:amino acid transporter
MAVTAGIEKRVSAGRLAGLGGPIGPWAFAGVAVSSFGGPLALAALNAPGLVTEVSDSAGLAMLAAVVVFALPLGIWLRYSRQINSPGGLYAFVEAAAGRRVALAQAAVWIVSYGLYLIYTTVQIVYDVLPNVVPVSGSVQTLLTLLIPVLIGGVMIAGRAVSLVVLGAVAVGQLVLAGILDAVTLAHISTPASSFTTVAPARPVAKATLNTSLLYICGSLPLFLGGELAAPARTIRRGLIGAFLLAGLVVVLAVAPLAAEPSYLFAPVPGVTVAQDFVGSGLADAIGIGVAVSIAGVILCEYLALTRLLYAIGPWRMRPITVAIGVGIMASGPISLIDPQGVYNTLLKPSLVALWLSQLIVFAVYPLFARRQRLAPLPAWLLGAAASALAAYGLWSSIQQAAS